MAIRDVFGPGHEPYYGTCTPWAAPQPFAHRFMQCVAANDTLGIVEVEGFPNTALNVDLSRNASLFCIIPTLDVLPVVVQRLRLNQQLGRKVREVITMLLVARMHHRDDSGAFAVLPREIMVLLCRHVWRTRTHPAWLALLEAVN